MKLTEMCSRGQGWFHLLYENNEYVSIKIGQYTHTRNYDLDNIDNNKNLMTDTLEIMGVGKNICSVFSKKKYNEWSEDCGDNHILMSWFPAELLPTLLKEIERVKKLEEKNEQKSRNVPV